MKRHLNRNISISAHLLLGALWLFTQPSFGSDGPVLTGADASPKSIAPPSAPNLPPLPIEQTGNTETLPKHYPESWVYVDEAAFFNMFSGKVVLIDVAEENPHKQMKGLMDKNLLGNFTVSKTRGEIYIMESFHERGSRGKKTDVLSVYSTETLDREKEIVWPKPNRLQSLPERYAMSVSSDEKYLYSSNFSPAASFSVVDLDTREIVTEIGTPGCVLTYPLGNRSVVSICSNGGLLTTVLNEDGTMKRQARMEPFFDTDDSPVFEHIVILDDVAYFPSFKGLMHEVDFGGDEAKYRGSWNMVAEAEQDENWRPTGIVLIDHDDAGHIYVIAGPDSFEGSQTHGGAFVWVFDAKKKERVQVIELTNWALSLAVTRGEDPYLVVTTADENAIVALDVFKANDGTFVRRVYELESIAGPGGLSHNTNTPLLVNKSY